MPVLRLDCPYKMVFAVATIDQVLVYTSESRTPVAVFGNLHFATITDMAFKGSKTIKFREYANLH